MEDLEASGEGRRSVVGEATSPPEARPEALWKTLIEAAEALGEASTRASQESPRRELPPELWHSSERVK